MLIDRTARRGVTPTAVLPRLAVRRVTIVDLPCARRRFETKQGGHTLFFTLADESGLAECARFPDAYRALARSRSPIAGRAG